MSEKSIISPLPNLNIPKASSFNNLINNNKMVPKTYPLERNLVIEIPMEEYDAEINNDALKRLNSDKCEDEQNESMIKTVR